ncbi:MAG: TraR/DksA family transcriptional regulator [Gammaproteobacteria bacterium]|nr:TraR/DksA family transcriptional regulator [Gammaproteobacteria bacterium]
MADASHKALREKLQQKKAELTSRLERISANLRRGYEADSKERAKQLEDNEVVDALGNEARTEIVKITAALQRMDTGDFGLCTECGVPIQAGRLNAYPYADECIECAEFDEKRRARP